MGEYRRGAHAVYDIKYHLIWITKYRYKVLRGRVAERARDLIRQSCQARDVVVVRGAVSPDHVHLLVSAPPQLAPSKLVQYLKGGRRGGCRTSLGSCGSGIGGSICGRAGISARRWARSTRQQSRVTSRARNGMKTRRASRLQRPPSLEPALSRDLFRRLKPQADFQS